VHYYYRDREEMAQEIAAGGFLEHAEVHGNLYGTSRKSLQEVASQGKMPILDVDVQGLVRSVRRKQAPCALLACVVGCWSDAEWGVGQGPRRCEQQACKGSMSS